MLAHYKAMIKTAEKKVDYMLKIQVREKGRFFGGCLDAMGMVHAKSTIYYIVTASAVYVNRDSQYYHREEVFEAIHRALQYVKAVQHENGLFDFVNCNFFSAPDTAFCIKRMMPLLKYLDAKREGEREEFIYQNVYEIVKKGAFGILQGGFHTPNHRWAIASNLLDCGRFFGSRELSEGAFPYLNEGIDCNADGEFAEKSSGNYNRINNDAMITIGEVLGEEKYFDYARRNLEMMLTYIEPDGSIFTANSTRQDNGKVVYPGDYYTEYMDLGCRLNIPKFLDMANYIMALLEEKKLEAPDYLIHMMNHPEWIALEHEGIWRQEDFNRYYQESGIVRAHQGEVGYTLMTGKSGFLYFANSTMHLEMKIGGSFCEHRAFQAETMEKTEKGYRLEQTMHGWYYLPFKEKPSTSDWWKMDNQKRDKILGPDLHLLAEVTEAEQGLDVHIKVEGEGVVGAPFRVELGVRGAKTLWNDQLILEAKAGESLILKKGSAIFSNETDSLEVGPAFCEHQVAVGMFGSDARSPHAFTLYFTAYTGFDKTIHIRSGHRVRPTEVE
ncbi:MAG: hypothetical protein Q4D90_07325 [bacterium]|nr:hypothetical protein [bacterium]